MGSFRIIGSRVNPKLVVIGFVLHICVVGVSPTSVGVKYRGGPIASGVVFLGSFRIIGENPEVSPGAPGQNSGEDGPPLARFLSDGGLLCTVCKSPCFWCYPPLKDGG